MKYLMLTTHRGTRAHPRRESKISVWLDGNCKKGNEEFRTDWFTTWDTQVLIQQLALADQVLVQGGAAARLHVLCPAAPGFTPGREVTVQEFIQNLMDELRTRLYQ